MSDLNDQLESIKAKNRRYKPSLTQRCYDGEEDGGERSLLERAPRAFRLGEEDEYEAGKRPLIIIYCHVYKLM